MPTFEDETGVTASGSSNTHVVAGETNFEPTRAIVVAGPSPADAFSRATNLLKLFREKIADHHWDRVKRAVKEHGSNAAQIITDSHYFSDRLTVTSGMIHEPRQLVLDLMTAFDDLPDPTLAPLVPKAGVENPRAHTLCRIELLMYQQLGLWLCTYFLGTPRSDIWEDVALLADRLGAFPGTAFYAKMGGDVYRLERLQRAKGLRSPSHKLLVMAYTPLLLIADEEDLNKPKLATELGMMLDPWHTAFMDEVGKLACRYLRFQAWRFFWDKESPAIDYAVSQLSLVRTLRKLADKRYAKFCNKDPEKLTDADRNTQDWKTKFTSTLAESDERLATFLSPGRVDYRLAVFSDQAMKQRGLTSCTLGQDDGAITNRPNRVDEETAFCLWSDGIFLREERQKLARLWQSPQDQMFEYPGKQPFSSVWCTPEVLETLKIPQASACDDHPEEE